MDIKIDGITAQLMSEALEQARQGRVHILDKMNEAITTHRGQLSQYAPQIIQVQSIRPTTPPCHLTLSR